MKSDVIITITDSHIMDDETTGATLTTVGKFWGNSMDYYIVYAEQDEELSGSETEIHVENENKVTMTRRGKYNTTLVIEPNQRHNCFYNTPAGELMMGIFAKTVVSEVDELGGELTFSYTIDFNSGFASENELKITIRKKDRTQCQC